MGNKKPKYSDGRRNNGALKGVSRGQGRPPKIKEKEMGGLTLNALTKAFGSEEKAWIFVAKKASKEQQININKNVNIPVIDLGLAKAIDIDHKEVEDE